jgi:superfamily II DNA or RNA helicase
LVDNRLPGALQATFWPAPRIPSDGHLALWGLEADALEAAVRAARLPTGSPAILPAVLPASVRARTRVAPADVPARAVPVLAAARALAALPPAADWQPWERPSAAVLAWSVAAKLALEWVAAGRVVPALRAAGPAAAVAAWRAVPSEDGRLAELAAAFPPAAHALRTDSDDAAVWPAAELLGAFCDAVADTCARMGPSARLSAITGGAAARWTAALAAEDPVIVLDAHETQLPEQIETWAASLSRRDGQARARLCLQLHTPQRDDPAATWPLDYHLQAADDPSLVVGAEQVWTATGASLHAMGRSVGDPQETLVRGLAEAARLFPPLDPSLSQPAPVGLDLTAADAAAFLTDGAGQLATAGLGVLLPAELTAAGARKLRARLRVGQPTPDPGKGITAAGLNADGLADFRWEIALGDEILSPAEFAEIAALKQPLVRWRGRWVRVDPDEALALADLAGTGGRLDPGEALAGALAGQATLRGHGTVEVVADGALAELVERLRTAAGKPKRPRLAGVDATLRAYQRTGVAWLQTLVDLGQGAVLADDMGLGKTLQTIALLADRTRRGGGRPHLVVCPTSVVGNWERELARFAPGLDVVRHHGPDRADDPAGFVAGAVTVTSYGLVRRDAELLASVDWDTVVLDEAQQVKNHAAQAAKAVRRLPAQARVALTGTPVENRLSELWSIMDFANPGLLGSFGAFKERYAVPVERWHDADAAAQLRRLCGPFLLRRTKREVATDLPEKVEYTVACALTREQATLYQAAVDDAFSDEGLGEGIDRRGRILALLTALKQICNHPAHYLGESGPLSGRSGKLARVTEMLGEVVAAGDRALVFTQYRAMGTLLSRHLAAELSLAEVPFLHGGLAMKQRQALVDRFQTDPASPPVLLVSLKAGGTGLNLTAATEVVHYDRWWNPAVEDQATDRAYRIGQTRAVTAHKLVTAGTLEERIAKLLEDKRALADAVVGTGETWLTELGDAELRELVALSAGDVADSPDDSEEAA